MTCRKLDSCPALNNLAFDVSEAIPPTSWYGTLLKGVFNFSPATTVLEAAAWLALLRPNDDDLPLSEAPAHASSLTPNSRASWGVRKEMIMTRPSRRAGEFAVPVRTLILASSCAVLGMPLLAGCTDNTSNGQFRCHGEREPACPDRAGNRLRVQALRDQRPVGHSHFCGDQRRLEGDRVLPVRRGWQAHRRRGGEHRPRHYPRAGDEGRARELHHRMQAGHGRRWHPRTVLSLGFR